MDYPISMQTSWTAYWMVVMLQVPNLLLEKDMDELFVECFGSLILRLFITCFWLFNSQAISPCLEITFGEEIMKGDWRVASLLQQFVVMNFFAWIPCHLFVRPSRIALLILLFCVDYLWLRVAFLPRFLSSYKSPTLIFIHQLAFYFGFIQWVWAWHVKLLNCSKLNMLVRCPQCWS